RAELVAALEEWRKTFGPPLAPAADQSPVPGWQVVTEDSGVLALTPSPRTQHVVGGVLVGLGAACAASLAALALPAFDVRLLVAVAALGLPGALCVYGGVWLRSEEHTSELQSLRHLVCRLPLEKKKNRRM